jgi:hypothetical protein
MSTVKSSRMRKLYERLSAAGFSRHFIQNSVLPSWWEDSLAEKETGFAHIALIIARYIGADVRTLLDTEESITLEPLGRVLFKSGGNTVPEALRATTSVCVRAAHLVHRATSVVPPSALPESAMALHEELRQRGHTVVTLDALLDWCWSVGIPVLHLKKESLPGKKPQALCLRVKGRPVVFLCDAHNLGAWQAFHLAHELGHILLGHLESGDSLWLDETIRRDDTQEQEVEANMFAVTLLLRDPEITVNALPSLKAEELAAAARQYGEKHTLDPQALVLNVFHHDTARVGRNMNAAKALEIAPPALERIGKLAAHSLNLSELSDDEAEYLSRLAGWESI